MVERYVVITGGVLSGLGKGVVTASIGRIIKSMGYKVVPIKIDGYINVDPGTMNPYEHGEVFVLDDGTETDLDLGHYERFLDISLKGDSNITTGRVYKEVIENERRGEYLGKTVQIIPHVTDTIKKRISKIKADVVLVEVGGTIGDLENMVFLEALRQMSREKKNKFIFIHLSFIPIILTKEQKTKPTQHSVKELLSIGIQPDAIMGRCKDDLTKETKSKIALFCGVEENAVFSDPDLEDIYELPLLLERQNMSRLLAEHIGLDYKKPDLKGWEKIVDRIKNKKQTVVIGIVGKYAKLEDAYISIKEAFKHASIEADCHVDLKWFEAEDIKPCDIEEVDGILVPGGFGARGSEGKITAIEIARKKRIPFLGICYGFQLAVIEYARNVCGMEDADTTENNKTTKYPVIDLLPEQKGVRDMGGTMQLGAYPCVIETGTLAHRIYSSTKIYARHRHRFEVNPEFIEILKKRGMIFSGYSPDGKRMEILEILDHPYFIASQFHPEFTSHPEKPDPLFVGLVKSAIERKNGNYTSASQRK